MSDFEHKEIWTWTVDGTVVDLICDKNNSLGINPFFLLTYNTSQVKISEADLRDIIKTLDEIRERRTPMK